MCVCVCVCVRACVCVDNLVFMWINMVKWIIVAWCDSVWFRLHWCSYMCHTMLERCLVWPGVHACGWSDLKSRRTALTGLVVHVVVVDKSTLLQQVLRHGRIARLQVTHLGNHPSILSFIYSSVHPLIHPPIHSLIRLLIYTIQYNKNTNIIIVALTP